jgi:protein TonB
MSAAFFFHRPPELPEWRRSGGYFLFALAIHAALLAWPHAKEIELPPPPLSVKLIEALKAPEPQPVALPPPLPPPPQAKPTPNRPRPVLAMTPEQQPATADIPVIAAPVAVAPEPAPRPPVAAPVAAAPTPVVPARYNAAYLNNPEPKYPPMSRRLGEEGKVLLRVRVTADGQAAAVELEKDSGFERLDEAAKQAVARWRFVPAKRGDEAIEASVIVPIVFRLDN